MILFAQDFSERSSKVLQKGINKQIEMKIEIQYGYR